jgi:hypothetical protein
MDDVIWMSVADGSWGGCDSDDLIVVDSAEFTDEEWETLNEASDREVFDIISKVHARTKRTRI